MTFYVNIMPNTLKVECNHDEQDETLSEAIQTIYGFNDGKIIINWNGFSIPSSIDNFSELFEQFTDIIEQVLNIDKGNFRVSLLSSSLTMIWEFFIDDNFIVIESNWITVPLDRKTIEQLKNHSLIKIDKLFFINEWIDFFNKILKKLEECGYENLDGYKKTKKLIHNAQGIFSQDRIGMVKRERNP